MLYSPRVNSLDGGVVGKVEIKVRYVLGKCGKWASCGPIGQFAACLNRSAAASGVMSR
jgi:hypothetical protein